MPYAKPVLSPDWMRLREVAQQLGCAPQTIRNRIKSGKIVGVRVLQLDGVTRVHRADWTRYMDQHLVPPEKVA
ncbi:helix-turn-helix domain-containing protein [Streptomyces sp. NPDC029006]|uniref:helix-turn-helix domain-containing protein n=1 Tax=Streptomyces sp. NPDC029006 TaxID=3155467 RepID=UPI0033C27A3C